MEEKNNGQSVITILLISQTDYRIRWTSRAPTKPSRRFTRAGAKMSSQASGSPCGNLSAGFRLELEWAGWRNRVQNAQAV